MSRFGRKMSFLVSNLLNGIAGILVAVAPNYVSLLVFRTLYGFGVKGGWVAGYVLSKIIEQQSTCNTFYYGLPNTAEQAI